MRDRERTIARLVPPWMKLVEPPDAAGFDPYNTGAMRVLARRPRRRTLDDLRRLDAHARTLRTLARDSD